MPRGAARGGRANSALEAENAAQPPREAARARSSPSRRGSGAAPPPPAPPIHPTLGPLPALFAVCCCCERCRCRPQKRRRALQEEPQHRVRETRLEAAPWGGKRGATTPPPTGCQVGGSDSCTEGEGEGRCPLPRRGGRGKARQGKLCGVGSTEGGDDPPPRRLCYSEEGAHAGD